MALRGILKAGLLCSLVLPGTAEAFVTDPMIEGAKQCTRHLSRYERQYGIPVHLLSAIASTESGRWHDSLRIALPWPWTINAEGKGYYYDSKDAAVTAARNMRLQGVKSMDVGCMQVNLMHHPNAFANLEQAFEPESNVAYAASFLRSLFDEQGNWKSAAAAYHSKTPMFGSQYVSRVYDRWYTIVDRVQRARGQVSQVAAAGGPKVIEPSDAKPKEYASINAVSDAVAPVTLTKPAPTKAKTVQPQIKPRSERKISVRNQAMPSAPAATARRSPDVLVIRPQAEPALPEAQAVAAATPAPATLPVEPATAQAKVVQVGTPAKPGPRFIFSE